MVSQNPYVDPWPSPAVDAAAVVLVGFVGSGNSGKRPGWGRRQDSLLRSVAVPAVCRAGGGVVGVDGSENSWYALSWACGEARRLRGRAVAVFVSSSPEAGSLPPPLLARPP